MSLDSRVTELMKSVTESDGQGWSRLSALREIWGLTESDENQIAMASPSLGLVPLLIRVVQEDKEEARESALGAICCLSVMSENKKPMASSTMGLVPLLVQVVREDRARSRKTALLILGNLAYSSSNVAILLENRVHTLALELLKADLVDVCFNETSHLSHCTYFLMVFSRFFVTASAVRSANGLEVLLPLLRARGVERLKATMIISFITGREESGVFESKSLLEAYPDVTIMLVDIFQRSLDLRDGDGYFFGTFGIPIIVRAVLSLSVSDSNKAVLIKTDLHRLLVRVLQLYNSNSSELRTIHGSVVGGGNDIESAEIAIEALLQLSFCFDSDTDLQSEYMTSHLGLCDLLKSIINLPLDRKHIGPESKRNASSLIARLTTRPESVLTFTASEQSPVRMISLSYAMSANKTLVIKLQRALESKGYIIWRDEEGTDIVGRLNSGETASDKMAEAMEISDFIIICVSPAYKVSANCRNEAKYATSCMKKGRAKLLFLMMDKNYTIHTAPNRVDGWLRDTIGDNLWF